MEHLVDVLLDAAATGVNRVERDGVSFTHSARFALVGTMNPEEGTLRPQLLDRFGLCVNVGSSLSGEERAEVIRRRMAFERDPEGFCAKYEEDDRGIAAQLRKASELLDKIEISDANLAYVASLCAALDVQGYRADITIMKAAVTLAALNGRDEVTTDDVLEAARFALPHRMKRRPFEEHELTDQMIRQAAENLSDRDENGKSGDSEEKK